MLRGVNWGTPITLYGRGICTGVAAVGCVCGWDADVLVIQLTCLSLCLSLPRFDYFMPCEWRTGIFGPAAVVTTLRPSWWWYAPVPPLPLTPFPGVQFDSQSADRFPMRVCGQPHLSSLIGKRVGLLYGLFWWFCRSLTLVSLLPGALHSPETVLYPSPSPPPLCLVRQMLASASRLAYCLFITCFALITCSWWSTINMKRSRLSLGRYGWYGRYGRYPVRIVSCGPQ